MARIEKTALAFASRTRPTSGKIRSRFHRMPRLAAFVRQGHFTNEVSPWVHYLFWIAATPSQNRDSAVGLFRRLRLPFTFALDRFMLSVFKKPLNYLIQAATVGGGLKALPGVDSPNAADWKFTDLGWIFSLAIVFLGLSAAVFGKWLERAGPRKAIFASAVCFCSGCFISAIGVQLHQLWLIYLGYGVIGGIGLGIGYISPVSTLIKWFPDRPGMATGMAIMGFGGGAFIASPLSVWLMQRFTTATHVGVAEAFLCLGAIYFFFMLVG